jgi:predicted RNase H-like nuclease
VIEETLQNAIYEKFGLGDLSVEEKRQIKLVDDALLYHEFIALMGIPVFDTAPDISMEHEFSINDFIAVEREFIHLFSRLTSNRSHFSSIGIDGCKNGWLVVNITPDGFVVDTFNNIEEICAKYRDFDCMIIDMPIGLPECVEEEKHRPDAAARKLLSHRSSCIFNTPCRQSVFAGNYPEANELNREHLRKGLSQQSFAISNKIREIDDFLKQAPDYMIKIMESHPEICFAMLSPTNKPINEAKNTSEGKGKDIRINILRQHYDKTTDFIEYVRNNPKLCKLEVDCIDALCLAVTGMLGLENGFNTIPENPRCDRRGLLMQMVYANKSTGDCWRENHLKPPYYIKCEDGGERIGVLAYHHREGGVCFLDVGWSLTSCNPFHILNGPFVAKETPEGFVYEAENGDFIRQLTENDRLWSGWQNWQDYLNSPDGARATEEEAVNGCQSNGALVDRPL